MTIRSYYDDYVITDRGGILENRYSVHAAIVDAQGQVLYAVGDPHRVTLARSAAKPAQSLAIIETGALDRFGFDDADLALMCASHSSEELHLNRARGMLAKAGAEEPDLRCGGHPAISDEVNRSWIKNDYRPTAICNNCSGKHAGMLAGAKCLNAGPEYHLPEHLMQRRVKRVVEELSGLAPNEVKWATDGCNLPAPAFPLDRLAKMYAFFADAADSDEQSTRASAARSIFQAMSQHPELVGGQGRFCTGLMQAFQGTLIGKLGADGCYGIGIRSIGARRIDVEGAVGIAVKIEDGDINILYSAVTEILEQLQIGTVDMRQKLVSFHRRKIFNTMNVVTGQVSHHFRVRKYEGTYQKVS